MALLGIILFGYLEPDHHIAMDSQHVAKLLPLLLLLLRLTVEPLQ